MVSHTDLANALRFLSIDMVNQANSGHPGMPMGMADVFTVLFKDFLRFDPENPTWENRDRLILSNGHGSALLYSALHLSGYDVSLDDLKNFRQLHSKTAGHPEYNACPGVEATTGPLGQGVAMAVGMAIAQKKQEARHGKKMRHNIYVSLGDGCLMEGVSHEACELAGAQKLDTLILMFDDNDISIDGNVSITSATNVTKRFESYGFNVLKADGHNPKAITKALKKAEKSDKPTLIRFKTSIGYGSPDVAGTSKAHGSPLGAEGREKTAKALGWAHAPFDIPEEIQTVWQSFAQRCEADIKDWQKEAEEKTFTFAELDQQSLDALNALKKEATENPQKIATRKAVGITLEALGAHPYLISGSADLTGSVNTLTSHMTALTKENRDGNFIHYGVREFAMGAVMNGLSLSGFIPLSGTFLAFADYIKPAMRLSALMQKQAIYVLTHDSIGLGEDGPTHQPVEHLAMLRALPNFNTFRPCDLIETIECCHIALHTQNTPSALIASRQSLPHMRTTYTQENLSKRGAYVIAKEDENAPLDAVILASGSEVHLAAEAQKELSEKGKNIRVISVPCLELFLQQEPFYIAALLPKNVKRVAVEAAHRQPWDRLLTEEDLFIGMSTFGASAPADVLYSHFGITKEAIIEAVL